MKFNLGLVDSATERVKLVLIMLFISPVWFSNSPLEATITEAEKTYLIQQVFEPKDRTTSSLRQCAYTVETTINRDRNVSERFTPWESKQNQWQLLNVNGEAPAGTQVANYVPTTRQRIPSIVNVEFIDEKTLKFVEEDLEGIRFSFAFKEKYKNARVHSNLSNTVVIDPIFARLIEITSEAREPFKMFPWLTVNHYECTQTFEHITELGSAVLTRFTLSVELKSGRTQIDQDLLIEYHSFDCTAPTSEDREINDDIDSAPAPQSEDFREFTD